MLIAVAGSQGSGKSSLINALADQGYQTVTRKTSRSILSEWGVTLSEVNNNRDLTVRFQDEILLRKMADELDAASDPNTLVVTERSFVDLFVYALIAIGKDNEYSDWIDSYYEKCKDAQRIYSHIYYLEAGHFQPVNDGVRAINTHYSRMVDSTMLDYSQQLSQDRLTIIHTPTLAERVDIIMNNKEKHVSN